MVKDGCVRTIQLSDGSNTIDRALTMLPELVDKVSALLKKEEKQAPLHLPLRKRRNKPIYAVPAARPGRSD